MSLSTMQGLFAQNKQRKDDEDFSERFACTVGPLCAFLKSMTGPRLRVSQIEQYTFCLSLVSYSKGYPCKHMSYSSTYVQSTIKATAEHDMYASRKHGFDEF